MNGMADKSNWSDRAKAVESCFGEKRYKRENDRKLVLTKEKGYDYNYSFTRKENADYKHCGLWEIGSLNIGTEQCWEGELALQVPHLSYLPTHPTSRIYLGVGTHFSTGVWVRPKRMLSYRQLSRRGRS